MTDYVFSERWPQDLLNGLKAKRAEKVLWQSRLKKTDTDFARAYDIVIRMYDAAIAAAERELNA